MPKRLSHNKSNPSKKKFKVNYHPQSASMPRPVGNTENPNPLQVDKLNDDTSKTVKTGDITESVNKIDKKYVKVEYLDTPVKSDNDKKDYR